MICLRTIAVLLLLGLTSLPLAAVSPDEVLSDPALEARARAIGKDLRCLVCQNQSIDESNADLARDLRVLVRERIVAGDSDQEVIAFVVDRYGDYVLLKPPLKAETYLLWFGPALLLLAAAFGGWAFYRAQRAGAGSLEAPLDPLDEARARQLLGEDGT